MFGGYAIRVKTPDSESTIEHHYLPQTETLALIPPQLRLPFIVAPNFLLMRNIGAL